MKMSGIRDCPDTATFFRIFDMGCGAQSRHRFCTAHTALYTSIAPMWVRPITTGPLWLR